MSATPLDPYAVLGVTPAATPDEITHAYRILLRRHHPDTRPAGDPQHHARSDSALAQLIAAYEILRDPTSRAAYDRRTGVRPLRVTRRQDAGIQRHRHRSEGQDGPPIVVGPVHWSPPS